MKNIIFLLFACVFFTNCKNNKEINKTDLSDNVFVWEGANVYFLLTDRFNNGDTSNDINFDRTKVAGKLRGFEGGDIKGVTQKIEEGYFTDLGINAIWMTPIVEQIHDGVDEGQGFSYGFHGYWTRDWTAIDPNFGTKNDLHKLIEAAHKKGIRILLDAVLNHTGPVTDKDPVWPENWVRTGPQCTYTNYESTTACTLVKNLPDIKTESNNNVDLPPNLVTKWKTEGRYDQEILELDAFFKRTGYPRAPRFYIIKWLTDYIKEFGIDGYRVDTVKHTEAIVWQEFKKECDVAFAEFKKNNLEKVLDNTSFYLVGEVYNYGISTGQNFDFGDKKVNYFDKAFQSLINFQFKWNAAQQDCETLFSSYSNYLKTDLKGFGTLNYMSSHDDSSPFDANRNKSFETGTKLLLAPGTSQVYYGDESARRLIIAETQGDATLRSFMNWQDIQNNSETKSILNHWQKLGVFRANHPAIGAGVHRMLTQSPYVFSRSFMKGNVNDLVVVGLNLPIGKKEINVLGVFMDGDTLHDAYSNQEVTVKNGKALLNTEFQIVLLEKK